MDLAALDHDRLAELETEIGAEDLRQVLDMFLQEAVDAVSTLRDDLSAGEYAKSMHFLRSGALNLGLAALAREARRIAALPDRERRAATVGPDLARAIEEGRTAVAARLFG